MDLRPLRFFLLIVAVMAYGTLSAQELRGRVVQPSGEPLAFVTVRINDSTTEGVLTDIEGWFKVKDAARVRSLTLSYLGFAPLRLAEEQLRASPLTVVMAPSPLGLPEVEVVAGENPAHRIIREAAARKDRHHPFNYPAWVCTLYNKISVDPLPQEDAFEERLALLKPERADSLRRRRDTLLDIREQRHFLFMESVVERYWLRPGRQQERVLLNRVSGFEEGRLLALAHAFQPFSFYEDHIRILENSYLNPVSRGSERGYRFVLEDTLLSGRDTIWMIRFAPREGVAFDGLQGALYIHGTDYAITQVVAEPARPGRIYLKMEQQFRKLPEGYWFPEQLIFSLQLPRYPDPAMGMQIQGRTWIDPVQWDPPLRARDFDPDRPLSVAADAWLREDPRWETFRPLQNLTPRELGAYQFMDSVGKAERFDRLTPWMDALASRALPLHARLPVRLDLQDLLRFSFYEDVRLTLGLTNRPAQSLVVPASPLAWRVWTGYGFRDHGWKYGAESSLSLWRPGALRLEGSFRQDLADPGLPTPRRAPGGWDRSFYAPRMDQLREWRAGLHARPLPGWQIGVDRLQSRFTPTYAYRFQPAGEDRSFDFREWRLHLRLSGYRPQPLAGDPPPDRRTRWPVLELWYSRSEEGLLSARPNWQRLVATFSHERDIRRLGTLRWRVEAGIADGPLPLARLFSVVPPPDKGFQYVWIPETLLTAEDLLLYDRFVQVFLRQDLGYRLWQTRRSRPLLALIHHASIGSLNKPEWHAELPFRTPPRGFQESGLLLEHLLHFNYLNIADLTFGAALIWRWAYMDRPAAVWPAPRVMMGLKF